MNPLLPVATEYCVPGSNGANTLNEKADIIQVYASDLPNQAAQVQLAPLQYMDVFIANQCWHALVVSGAEVPLIHRRVLGNADVSTVGSIFIQPIVGPTVEAKLVALVVSQNYGMCMRPMAVLTKLN